jgi:hypothetical protein
MSVGLVDAQGDWGRESKLDPNRAVKDGCDKDQWVHRKGLAKEGEILVNAARHWCVHEWRSTGRV